MGTISGNWHRPKKKKSKKGKKAHQFQTVSQILASLPPHKRYPLAAALGRRED